MNEEKYTEAEKIESFDKWLQDTHSASWMMSRIENERAFEDWVDWRNQFIRDQEPKL